MKLGFTLVSLGIFILLLTAFSDGRQLGKYYFYKKKSIASVAEIRPFTINDSRNAVEVLDEDGVWQKLRQTEDRAVQLRPYGFLLFEEKKPMIRFEWQAEGKHYRANYRYLRRKPTWQVGDTVELHYAAGKPWSFAVEDPRLPGQIARNALVSALIFAMGILAMTFVQSNVSRKDDAPNRDHAQMRMQEAQPAWEAAVITYAQTEHGEDYEIRWEDPGMEERIRYLLDKETEPVLHSDVWNVQVLSLHTNMKLEKGGFDSTDVMLYDPEDPEGGIRRPYSGRQFPNIRSFRDLRHFDSLQRLESNIPLTKPAFSDLSGLESCGMLKDVSLNYLCPESLAPLAGLQNLESVLLNCRECPSLDLSGLRDLPNLHCLQLLECGQTELSALANLSGLRQLMISGSGTIDLAPLAQVQTLEQLFVSANAISGLETLEKLPGLCWLSMRADALPDLEPLTQTHIRYLDLSLDFMTQNQYREGNYEPLSRMQDLTWLNLAHHKPLDYESCLQIVEGNPGLKYLDISYTPAAERSGDLPDENILALVDAMK